RRRVVARGAARAAVDHQLRRILGDLRIEVVAEHPQRRLLLPAAAVQLAAARRVDVCEVANQRLDERRMGGGCHGSTLPRTNGVRPLRCAEASTNLGPWQGRWSPAGRGASASSVHARCGAWDWASPSAAATPRTWPRWPARSTLPAPATSPTATQSAPWRTRRRRPSAASQS